MRGSKRQGGTAVHREGAKGAENGGTTKRRDSRVESEWNGRTARHPPEADKSADEPAGGGQAQMDSDRELQRPNG